VAATSIGHGRLAKADNDDGDDTHGEELDSGSGGSCQKRTQRGRRSPAAFNGDKLHDEEANRRQTGKKLHEVQHARSRAREERTLTLICGSIHCIHLRTKCPNIFMYRMGRIYKECLKKYNNRKG
jgi:hypothetical protein